MRTSGVPGKGAVGHGFPGAGDRCGRGRGGSKGSGRSRQGCRGGGAALSSNLRAAAAASCAAPAGSRPIASGTERGCLWHRGLPMALLLGTTPLMEAIEPTMGQAVREAWLNSHARKSLRRHSKIAPPVTAPPLGMWSRHHDSAVYAPGLDTRLQCVDSTHCRVGERVERVISEESTSCVQHYGSNCRSSTCWL